MCVTYCRGPVGGEALGGGGSWRGVGLLSNVTEAASDWLVSTGLLGNVTEATSDWLFSTKFFAFGPHLN